MNDITLVTPPDKLYNTDFTFLLIYPSKHIKAQFNDILSKFESPITVYLYEESDENQNPEWLLDSFYKADCVIIDIDHCEPRIRDLTSYFISKNKTFWLTNGGENFYNVISNNRLFNLDFLSDKLGGWLEK